jgi:hypothetical protein
VRYRIKAKHPRGYVETALDISNPSEFVRLAIRDGYKIILITQEETNNNEDSKNSNRDQLRR